MPVRDIIEDAGLTDVVEAVIFVHPDLQQEPDMKGTAWCNALSLASSAVSLPTICLVVWGRLSCDFKYDSEDWEALGVEFERQLYTKTVQIWPPVNQPAPADMVRAFVTYRSYCDVSFCTAYRLWAHPPSLFILSCLVIVPAQDDPQGGRGECVCSDTGTARRPAHLGHACASVTHYERPVDNQA